MPACEKCWREAGGDPDRYQELLFLNKCTLEEQAGPEAMECPRCKRRIVHQYAKVCMDAACGYDAKAKQA